MEIFATKVNGFYPLIIIAKLSILNACVGPGYASVTSSFTWTLIEILIFDFEIKKASKGIILKRQSKLVSIL